MYYVFHGQNFKEILHYVKKANTIYWTVGVVLVVFFILNESVIIHYIMRSMNQDTRISHCFLYSFVGFFFSLVTPSATGGQPLQFLFMKKDRIPVHLSAITLLIITIAYKMVLVIFGFLVLLLRPHKIVAYLRPAVLWVYIGIALNVVVISVLLALVYIPRLLRRIVMTVFGVVKRLIHSQKIAAAERKLESSMDKYRDASQYLRTHKKIIANVILLTIIQRCFMFMVTYFVLLSFGVRTIGFFTAVVLQAMIFIAVDMLPLPGGMGISEHLFMIIFLPICGAQLTTPVMIVSRGLEYYTQLIISALFTVVAYLIIFKRKKA